MVNVYLSSPGVILDPLCHVAVSLHGQDTLTRLSCYISALHMRLYSLLQDVCKQPVLNTAHCKGTLSDGATQTISLILFLLGPSLLIPLK